ncbi:MAG TPA: MgtC/SapB family protein [Lacipirellulaceae bacterium]|jgi:putative Mg2+ transporter-C (MgtC) family protein|nr:MgtC/SapB family protein [Lacipirellulaceae bacterium]
MPTTLSWYEIAVRLLLTVVGGALLGLNRGEHGRPAGLRTTILVCLAASVSMIQANLLLATAGKPPDSFIVLDLMRLPLGILSGMGFIGGGVILRRGSMLIGVTTAATLWFVTVMGLCFGGGQLGLGLTMLVIGLFVLSVLKWIEDRLERTRRATIVLTIATDGPSEREIRDALSAAELKIVSCDVTYNAAQQRKKLRCELQWNASPKDNETPAIVEKFSHSAGITQVRWNPT